MNVIDAINNLTERGVAVKISFDEASIQKFLLWGVLAALVAGALGAFVKKAIG